MGHERFHLHTTTGLPNQVFPGVYWCNPRMGYAKLHLHTRGTDLVQCLIQGVQIGAQGVVWVKIKAPNILVEIHRIVPKDTQVFL